MPSGTAPSRRPRLALPFTVLASPGRVRLVAGEDFRYTLEAEGLERWLPGLLASLDGRATQAELLSRIPEGLRASAAGILDRLFGERVLVNGTAQDAHRPAPFSVAARGKGPLAEGWLPAADPFRTVSLLCQDRLELREALEFNRSGLQGAGPWMWASTGAMARGYVSPVFLPGSGPCLVCLLGQFRRRSPVPELYPALLEADAGVIEPVPFPDEGLEVLRSLIRWKVALLAEAEPPVAPFRLHVLEVASLEVSSHRVFLDPECEACRGQGR